MNRTPEDHHHQQIAHRLISLQQRLNDGIRQLRVRQVDICAFHVYLGDVHLFYKRQISNNNLVFP